jgi:hypothetical protein
MPAANRVGKYQIHKADFSYNWYPCISTVYRRPQTERAIRWFQSVDKLPVTGQIDDPTLKALRIG